MTESEALMILENLKPGCGEQLVFPEGEICEAIDISITALKEIQQYREIGTVEECREAMEKQAAERINYETNAVFNNGFGYYRIGKCPICNSCYNSNDEIKYCSKCGKKLDWSKENE